MNERGCLGNMRTDGLECPWNIRTSESGWLKRWMPPSGRSSLKQAQQTQSGYFPSASPLLPILVLFPYATCMRHWLPLCIEEWCPSGCHYTRAQGPTSPSLHKYPCTSNWDSISSYSFMSDISFISTPPVRHSLTGFIVDPMHKRQDCSPTMHLIIGLARGPCQNHRGQCQQWAHHSTGQRVTTCNTTGGVQQQHGCLWEYWTTWQWGQH